MQVFGLFITRPYWQIPYIQSIISKIKLHFHSSQLILLCKYKFLINEVVCIQCITSSLLIAYSHKIFETLILLLWHEDLMSWTPKYALHYYDSTIWFKSSCQNLTGYLQCVKARAFNNKTDPVRIPQLPFMDTCAIRQYYEDVVLIKS